MKRILKAYAPSKQINDVTHPPTTANSSLPKWYKDIPRSYDTGGQVIRDGVSTFTVKPCVPYLEAMTAGYTINLWCDIQVTQQDSGPFLEWTSDLPPVTGKSMPSSTGLPSMNGFSKYIFGWNMPWGIKPPKGYSLLITHPLNRPDLPFHTLSGIVDADNYPIPGLATFAVDTSFSGFIKEGTPILQVIPIKREEWKLDIDNSLSEQEEKKRYWVGGIASGGAYKRKFWVPKSYE